MKNLFNLLSKAIGSSNNFSKKIISYEEYKYFTYGFKKSTNLGKMYFFIQNTSETW